MKARKLDRYSIHTLSNGLKVALLPTKSQVVYCGFAIHSGSRNDPPHLPGLAHFVEHTIFKGTKRRKAWHINSRMELVGGDLNAYTTKEATFIYTVAPKGEMRRSIDLLNDLIRHATFPEQELLKEKEVIKDEINLYLDNPSDRIFDHFEELLFEDYHMSHPILGNRESLDIITQADCLEYARKTFVPSKMIFFCMGQVSESRFDKLTGELLSAPFAYLEPHSPSPTSVMRHFGLTQESDTHQAHVLIGGKAPTLFHEDRVTSGFISNMLAGTGMNSRLVVELREHRGWVYNVESTINALPDLGWWQIYYGCDPSNSQKALKVVFDQLKRLTQEPLSPTALRAWKKQIKGQATMTTEHSESTFLAFGLQLLLEGEYKPLEHIIAQIDAVSSENLQRVANDLFEDHNISHLIYQGR